MKKREFNKLCRLFFGKKQPLPDEQKQSMLLFVVRNRLAIHKSLVTPLLNRSWLNSMGYLYQTGDFIHTCENKPEIA